MAVDAWLDACPGFTTVRKNELRKVAEDTYGLLTSQNIHKSKYGKNKMFMKDETYPEYKYPRLINSRHDAFKVRTGPIFKLIEQQLFALPWFIKHTPVDLRSAEILRDLTQDGAKIVGTDYTSFEALFTKELMECCEMQLYRYMTQLLPDRDWYPLVHTALTGQNVCDNKFFTAKLNATRMSGEMCTSLGNSFMNLMVFLFIAQKNDLKSVKGRVEGDDGIFTFYGKVPTSADFEELGLFIKIVEYDKVTEGSFCGIIADDVELINIREPIEALLDFNYTTCEYACTSFKVKMELLRAKAFSMKYQYDGCPILHSVANWGLRMTDGYRFRLNNKLSAYEREKFDRLYSRHKQNLPMRKPGLKTRLLMEKRFKITIAQQLYLENLYDCKNDLLPICDAVLLALTNFSQRDYYNRFVTYVEAGKAAAFGSMYHRMKYQSGFSLLV